MQGGEYLMADLITTIASFTTSETTITVPKEFAWDFNNNDFLLVDGKFQIVTGTEALKVWIRKALKTPNSIYEAYSTDYGSNLDSLVGTRLSISLIESESKRIVWECISINNHITGMNNFSVNTTKDILTISFTALTDQGEVTITNV
jgi:hypothetical protein